MIDPENPEDQTGQELSSAEETQVKPVEGGYVRDLEEYSYSVRHREDTARWLAFALVGILGGSFALHYLAILVLEFNGMSSAVESLTRAFNSWLPVIASLVGGAVTYYFTREKR